MSLRKIRAIIFDLDGTLADTFAMIVAAWNEAVSPLMHKTYSDAEVIARFGIPDAQMIRRELEHLPREASDRAVEVYHAYYAQNHHGVTCFAGIREMLAELCRRAVPLGVMTGKGRRSAGITLEALGLADTFAAVVTGDDVPRQKPDPAGPLEAARRLGVEPPACAFVGDSPADVGAGKAAGMITVAAGWHPVYVEEVRKLRPDVWAEIPADVVRLIL
jgi:HAD superfamily hydrolase (TIGR01549 family)